MYWKYFKYVIKHKWYVFKECLKAGIIWRGIVHDLSKFLPSEFIPYARFFYGDYPEYKSGIITQCPHLFKEDIQRRFDMAWLLHIHRNNHHWQYYLLQEDDGAIKKMPIPVKYLKEMVCDWRGAGKAITGKDDTLEWYLKNKERINLKRINRKWIERELGINI